jgi:coenzyme F420 hydrogenase subunit beta
MLYWSRFESEVLIPGNCMHCGACVGLHPDLLGFRETVLGPLPYPKIELSDEVDARLEDAWQVCTGRGVPFPELFEFLHQRQPSSRLIGPTLKIFTGHSGVPSVRRGGASGGILTSLLIELLESGKIDGAVVLQQGYSVPDKAEPVIVTSREEVLSAAQSIYAVTPLLTILPEMQKFNGVLAVVALPEQVAALRMLQFLKHPAVNSIKYIFGPFTGTNMYYGAVRAFLRMNKVKDSVRITKLRWRAGEWPGKLRVEIEDGRVFEEEKFYYNYLTPFYISRHCRLTPDFCNELTDISVGDAWSPKYESKRGGYSVIVTRSQNGLEILEKMKGEGKLVLEETEFEELISMHSHMLDFKKRGAFIRLYRQKRKGQPIPEYGYWPDNIYFSRVMMESLSGLFFWFGSKRAGKWLLERFPVKFMGKVFSHLRVKWKRISRPARSKGLPQMTFHLTQNKRWRNNLS